MARKPILDNQTLVNALLAANPTDTRQIDRLLRDAVKDSARVLPRHSDLLAVLADLPANNKTRALKSLLKKRAVRTMSGIAPVAVLTKPYPCPGKCAYCPSEIDVPQSYLSNEPAVMRAIRCHYNPYLQVHYRLQALEANGHEPNKIELIVIGGTWSYLPKKYQYWYVANCFAAANNYSKLSNMVTPAYAGVQKKPRDPRLRGDDSIKQSLSLVELKKILAREQKKNESADYRIIGVTLETRPDYINGKELQQMRELGCTRVELGVQAIDDQILKLNRRGNSVAQVADATRLLKNYGFKVTYHLMPALPGSTPAKDLQMFRDLFAVCHSRVCGNLVNQQTDSRIRGNDSAFLHGDDNAFSPDQIKFYPTVVTAGSLLYRWYKDGKYKPYTDDELQNLIIECKKIVPEYCRIIRLIRDIPEQSIIAGNRITNLRQIMQQRGIVCRCIRCREAGNQLKIKNPPEALRAALRAGYELKIQEYNASNGKEYFIQAESEDGKILYGFCRLRLANAKHGVKILDKAALIRELHVYGQLVPVGDKKIIQHAGLGKKLMAAAEKIAKENGYQKMAVISGVGVRGYYRQLGYRLQDTYMIKKIKL